MSTLILVFIIVVGIIFLCFLAFNQGDMNEGIWWILWFLGIAVVGTEVSCLIWG